MADPFSIGAGIIGIISVTIKISQTVAQFSLDWKDAPKDVRMFMAELEGLKTVLSETHTNILVNPDFAKAFQNQPTAVPSYMVRDDLKEAAIACSAELDNLLNALEKRAKGGRLGWERLKGPLIAQNTRNSVDRLHRHCQILNNRLSIGTAMLGAITHREVNQARREQQEWHELKKNKKILKWLSPLSFHEKQRDILSKHHPGTGRWFLGLDPFKAWRDGDVTKPSVLWCPGIRE